VPRLFHPGHRRDAASARKIQHRIRTGQVTGRLVTALHRQ
jgi:hypothetical protein